MRRAIPLSLVLTLVFAVTGGLRAESRLKELNKELVEIAARVTPTVVAIEVPPAPAPKGELKPDARPDANGDRPFQGPWRGLRRRIQPTIHASGVIMSADGAILTSADHFRGRTEAKVTVTLSDGRRFPGKLLAKDLRTGLAAVKIDGNGLRAVKLAGQSPPAGSLIVACSHATGLGTTVRLGMISGTNRAVSGMGGALIGGGTRYTGLLQMTTPVSAWDLGGAVIDLDGNMVGMIHGAMTGRARAPRRVVRGGQGIHVFQMEAFGDPTVQGVSFAMPVEAIARVFTTLRKGEKVQWGYLGLFFALEPGKGLWVRDVVKDGPAKAAGLQPKDVIRSLEIPGQQKLTFKGQSDDLKKFPRAIGWTAPGTVITLGITRDGRDMDLEVTLAAAPDVPERQAMVLPHGEFRWQPGDERMEDLLKNLRQWENRVGKHAAGPAQLGVETEPAEGGMRVAGVLEGTAAEKAGLRAGDVILRIGDAPTATVEGLRNEIQKHKPGDKVSLAIRRDDKEIVVEATLGAAEFPKLIEFRAAGAYLGIEGEHTEDGLRIKRVLEDSPADKAGLKTGDIVLRADEKDIAGIGDLRDIIRRHKPGDEIAMSIHRNRKEIDLKVKLGRPPAPVAPGP